MGFAGPAAFLIVLTAVAYGGHALVGAWFDAAGDARAAEEGAIERLRERYETRLNVTNVNHEKQGPAGVTTITVVNEGPHVLWPHRVSVVVDGVLKDASVTSRTVNGVDTQVWGPWEALTLEVQTKKDAPDRVHVTAGNGAHALWVRGA